MAGVRAWAKAPCRALMEDEAAQEKAKEWWDTLAAFLKALSTKGCHDIGYTQPLCLGPDRCTAGVASWSWQIGNEVASHELGSLATRAPVGTIYLMN